MSEAKEVVPVAVLPPTLRNLAIGAGFSSLFFPQLVGLIFGISVAVSATSPELGLSLALLTYAIATVSSAVVGTVAIVVLGVPLSLLSTRVLRGVPSVRANVVGQFGGGLLAAAVVVLLVVVFGIEGVNFGGLTIVLVVLAAGVAASIGWWLALLIARHPSRSA